MFRSQAQRVTRNMFGNRPRLEIHAPEHKPHWVVYGKGVANFEAEANMTSQTLSLEIEETRFANPSADQKRDTSKRTMLTLETHAARAMYDLLKEMFEAPSAKPEAPSPEPEAPSGKRFTLAIDCGNAALDDGAQHEIARILTSLANRITSRFAKLDEGFILHDINGNRIGVAKFEGA